MIEDIWLFSQSILPNLKFISNCGPLPQKKPSGNGVNITVYRASKNVFDKETNLLVPDAETQDQSGKESCAVNDLGISEEINQEKMSEEELEPAISSHSAEMAMKYWSEESKNPAVVNKIPDGLNIPTICSGIRLPILNEAVAKIGKLCHFIKELIRDYQIFKNDSFLLHQQSLK